MENQHSMLPQPKARPASVVGALIESSDSNNNIRNAMPPPTVPSLKRQASNLPEPAPKRKTLVERAGEPARSISTLSRSTNEPSQHGQQNGAFSTYRNFGSSSSAQSSRSVSNQSRTTSSSSVTGSIGHSGIKPPTSHSGAAKFFSSIGKGSGARHNLRPGPPYGQYNGSNEILKDKKNFDPEEPYQDFHRLFEDTKKMYQDSMSKAQEAREETTIFKETMHKLEQERSTHTESIIALKAENETLKYRIEAAERLNVDIRREASIHHEESKQQHRSEIDRIRSETREQIEQTRLDYRNDIQDLKSKHEADLLQERKQRQEVLNQTSTQGALEKQKHQLDLEAKDQEIRNAKMEVDRLQADLAREKETNDDLRKTLMTAGDNVVSMETAKQALQAKIAFLESDNQAQSESYAAMERRMNEAISRAEECEEKLRKEETLRRKLHNQVQELKGNIRVFCRVRPPSANCDEDLARMNFPDPEESTDIEVRGIEKANALGKVTAEKHPFSFDRVFDTTSSNAEIFNEISQLIQSALDGYNVCIFAYGQTGSGKTFTMSSDDGMIPQALRQIYSTSKDLEGRGWKYSMEGSFVEVYNEDIRDLLGEDEKGAKKHEIRHDMVKCETTITDVTTLNLDSQEQVESILSRAMSRRSVAATNANERSSRSHSVFILKLSGENSITGEKSKGTLNLVDLAGSERLNQSKVEGQRLKETQSINKSLSCLGDVIGALGTQQSVGMPSFDGRTSVNGTAGGNTAHIPYRNSKLTYLLQFSLGGNSKTLMFVMVAPEKRCLAETLTSLKFAEKVAKTKIGVAKKVK